ncbi:MAG: CapA family protein [Bacillota bacterium]
MKLLITTLIYINIITSIFIPSNFKKEVKLMAVGDIMMHLPQIKAGEFQNGHDYSHFFDEVSPILKKGDITIGNLETTLAGKEHNYSGYPMFNAPKILAKNLKDSGFTILNTANNHSLDKLENGVLNTIDTINKSNLNYIGTSNSKERKNYPLLINKKGINLAFFSYTYGTNGIPIPNNKDYLVNLIDKDLIKEDLKKVDNKEVDFKIIYLHFGNEYKTYPNNYQKELVSWLFDNGFDVVLGSHPHVLQPMEKYNVNNKRKFVIYSLGNFISNQRDKYRDSSIILEIDLEKNFLNGKTDLKNVNFHPTWVYRYYDENKYNYKILLSEKNYEFLPENINKKMKDTIKLTKEIIKK